MRKFLVAYLLLNGQYINPETENPCACEFARLTPRAAKDKVFQNSDIFYSVEYGEICVEDDIAKTMLAQGYKELL